MKRRKSREVKRGRIEIIPMIDVMFFLLATFMLSSLSMQNLDALRINLPQGEAEHLHQNQPLTLTVTHTSQIYVNHTRVTLSTLSSVLKPLIAGDTQQNIIVSADNTAPQGVVVQTMLKARAAGAEHFLIAVKHE